MRTSVTGQLYGCHYQRSYSRASSELIALHHREKLVKVDLIVAIAIALQQYLQHAAFSLECTVCTEQWRLIHRTRLWVSRVCAMDVIVKIRARCALGKTWTGDVDQSQIWVIWLSRSAPTPVIGWARAGPEFKATLAFVWLIAERV